MSRYHLSPNFGGEPRPCGAEIKCDFAELNDGQGIEHYETKKEAQAAFERNMEVKNDGATSTLRKSSSKTLQNDTSNEKELSKSFQETVQTLSDQEISNMEHDITKKLRKLKAKEKYQKLTLKFKDAENTKNQALLMLQQRELLAEERIDRKVKREILEENESYRKESRNTYKTDSGVELKPSMTPEEILKVLSTRELTELKGEMLSDLRAIKNLKVLADRVGDNERYQENRTYYLNTSERLKAVSQELENRKSNTP